MSVKELKNVFEACNPDKDGFISLHNFANIGRMYAGTDQVDQMMGLLKPSHKDKISFDEFCLSLSTLIEQDSSDDEEKENADPTITAQDSPQKSWLQLKREQEDKDRRERRGQDKGQREENYIREPSSDRDQQVLGAKLGSPRDPRKKMKKRTSSANMLRRTSQTRLTGAIPLVNTSSEDDNDLEDSFDRQIAASLEQAGKHLAAPAVKPRYLVRGSSIRSTVRTKSSSTMLSMLNVTHEPALLTPGHLGVSPIHPTSDKDSGQSDLFFGHNETDEEDDDEDKFTTPKSRDPSRQNSPDTYRGSMYRVVEGREDVSGTRSILEGLEHKMETLGQLQESMKGDDSGENKYTIKDLKVDLEAEMEKLRIEARERLEEERERFREQIKALNKERALERNNFQLRLDHAEDEVNRLHQENQNLNNQVRLLCEKRMVDEEDSKMSLGSDKVEDDHSERFHAEYLSKIQQLMARLEDQDNQIIELKEDNVVLRNQKVHLVAAVRGDTNKKKRNFLGISPSKDLSNTINDLDVDDPSDIRVRIQGLHRQLYEQRDINASLKSYVDSILANIMSNNPDLLEKIS